MSFYQTAAMIHAGLGTVALFTFWGSGLSKKGSALHRASGKLYLLSMTGLLALALPMSLRILASGRVVIGSFLLYLLVITVTAVWNSWRAIRDKRDWARYTGPVYRALMWLNLVGGLVIAYVGLFEAKMMQLVITSFAAIGVFGFVGMWRFAKQPPEDPCWWLREHLAAMLGNGVATHIAFLSIGLPRLLPMLATPSFQALAWLGPVVIATIAGMWLTRRYLPKRPARVTPEATPTM
jgi:hypothetical protein